MSFAGQQRMNLEQFVSVLERQGTSYVDFRETVRQQMMVQRLQRSLVSRRIVINDAEIESILEAVDAGWDLQLSSGQAGGAPRPRRATSVSSSISWPSRSTSNGTSEITARSTPAR